MSRTLVFNVGSSSIKYAIYDEKTLLLSEHFERITTQHERHKTIRNIALTLAQKRLIPNQIGHRIVHGGTLTKTTLITPEVRKQLTDIAELAPLHDIPELEVVDMCEKVFELNQYAVFDTAFHQTIPRHIHQYAIPQEFYDKGIRKYGFHGISHEFISQGLKGNVITCHLGSGASICAIQNGKSLQTSMGFTPLDGLMMGTRAGAIDAGVISYLNKHEHISVPTIKQMLNKESGLKGICGLHDVRDVLASKSPQAKLALDMYVSRIVETIGGYVALLGGVDTIVFSAGTGENSPIIRKMICEKLSCFDIKLDAQKNKKAVGVKSIISQSTSKVQIHVVPTNEELAIVQKIDLLIRKV